MSNRSLIRVFLVSCCLMAAERTAHAGELVVIVNAANPVTTLDKAAVRAYYLKLKPTWADGEKVRAVDIPSEAAERAEFITKVLGMSVAEFERHWIERQYANGDGPPSKAPDEAAVIKLVQLFKGGIGFVSKAAVDKAGDARIKVIHTAP